MGRGGRKESSPWNGGFTLIELTVVVFIISLILAIGLPNLLPVIATSRGEGAARHLAGYGRALANYAGHSDEQLTFWVDLDAGTYWTVRLKQEDNSLFDDEPLFEDKKLFDDSGPYASASASLEAWGSTAAGTGKTMTQAEQMDALFERFTRSSLESRARNVPKPDLAPGEKPLFEKEFSLDWNEDDAYEDVPDDLLARTQLPEGTRFSRVQVGNRTYTSGKVDVPVTPLGLSESIIFFLDSGKHTYQVEWDAITGGSHTVEDVENPEDGSRSW